MLEEYVNGDNDLPVCTNMDSDTWNETFLTEDINDEDEDENDEEVPEEQIDEPPPPPMINSFKEAIQSLEGIQDFLERKECMEEAMDIASMANLKFTSAIRQTTLFHYV